jgi:hypothetical protein
MAITFINSTALTLTAAASTWSIPTHSSRHGGAAFVVGIGPASSAVTVSTITDNTTNIYRRAVARGTPKPAGGAELWYTTNLSSASTRIFVTLSGASSGSLGVGQFDGISTANALLQTGSSAITSNSTLHGASEITPSQSSAVVVSFARMTASTIGTVNNLGGMTTWLSTAQAVRTHGMYIIQTTASTCTGSFRTSSNCQHAAVIAAFSDTVTVLPFTAAVTRSLTGFGV